MSRLFHTNWKLLLSAYLFKPASWVLYFPFNLPYPQLKSRNFYILGHWIFSPKIRTAPGNLKRLVTLNQYSLFPPSSKLLSCTYPWSIHNAKFSLLLIILPSILLVCIIWHFHNSNQTKRQREDLCWEMYIVHSKSYLSSKNVYSCTNWTMTFIIVQSYNCANLLASDTFTKDCHHLRVM